MKSKPATKDSTMRISRADYHRNGIAGEGFWTLQVWTTDDGGSPIMLLVTIDADRPQATRAIEPANLDAHYRGDVYFTMIAYHLGFKSPEVSRFWRSSTASPALLGDILGDRLRNPEYLNGSKAVR